MAETRRFKLTKRVKLSFEWIWDYNKEYVSVFNFIPCINLSCFGSAFKAWRDVTPRYIIQFNWLYISLGVNIFVITKLKDK